METPAQSDYLFSPISKKEKFLRRLYWLLLLLFLLLLSFFWEPLRSTRFTYSLVSITIGFLPLEIFFRVVTILGSEGFFLILFAIIYWSVDKSLGFWGLILMPLSIFLTSEVPKDIIRLPRPDVRGVSVPTYTFPSGHTSGAVCVWGYLSFIKKKPWLWIGSTILILLIGLSRIFLGYHFPGDVLGGLVTGMAFLFLFFLFQSAVMSRASLEKPCHPFLLAAFLLVPFSLSFLPVSFGPRLMGYLTGTGLGYLLEEHLLRFTEADTWKGHLLQGAIGLTGLAVITLGLDHLILSSMLRLKFAQYALATFWIMYLSPLLFLSIKKRGNL